MLGAYLPTRSAISHDESLHSAPGSARTRPHCAPAGNLQDETGGPAANLSRDSADSGEMGDEREWIPVHRAGNPELIWREIFAKNVRQSVNMSRIVEFSDEYSDQSRDVGARATVKLPATVMELLGTSERTTSRSLRTG